MELYFVDTIETKQFHTKSGEVFSGLTPWAWFNCEHKLRSDFKSQYVICFYLQLELLWKHAQAFNMLMCHQRTHQQSPYLILLCTLCRRRHLQQEMNWKTLEGSQHLRSWLKLKEEICLCFPSCSCIPGREKKPEPTNAGAWVVKYASENPIFHLLLVNSVLLLLLWTSSRLVRLWIRRDCVLLCCVHTFATKYCVVCIHSQQNISSLK